LRVGRAQEHAHAGGKFAAVEGLGEVVVGAGVESGDLLGFTVAHGEDEHGDLAPFAKATEDFEAAHIGEAEVEDNGVGRRSAASLRPRAPDSASRTR